MLAHCVAWRTCEIALRVQAVVTARSRTAWRIEHVWPIQGHSPKIIPGSFGMHTAHTGVALPIGEGVYVFDPVVVLRLGREAAQLL